MSYLSIVINVDTRPERDNSNSMFNGCVSRDFLTDGILNKINLFKGFEKEIIVYCDEHEPIPEETLSEMKRLADTLIIRKHDKRFESLENCTYFNDLNYIQALSQCRGEIVFHFDGDVAAFTPSPEPINEMISLLDQYDYISYPSLWSPNPVNDPSFGGKYWVSTRFFCCKRSILNLSEILKCQMDYDYWKETYPVPRLCHWIEHLCGSIAWNKGKGVYYPPVNFDNFIMFTWANYHKYTLQRLNHQSFEEVRDWVKTKHYHYPADLSY